MDQPIRRKIMIIKKIFCTIFLMITLLLFLDCEPTSQEQFLQANVAYKKGDFKKAADLYQSIENKGAAVWYNLGNCCYHLEMYVDALVYWKRALKNGGSFLHDAITYNCKFVCQKLGVPNSTSFLKSIIVKISSYSFFLWQIVFLIILYIFLGLMVYVYGKKQYLIGSLSLCLLCLSGSCLGIKYWTAKQIDGMVKHETSLVAGTDERFSKITMLVPGQEVIVQDKRDSWCKVKSNEHAGWVLAENIEYI